MKILFIRHALAEDREDWEGDDFLRPLVKKGKEEAEIFFSKLPNIYRKIDLIVTSKATRAKETAKILNDFYKTRIIERDELSPGCDYEMFEDMFKNLEKSDIEIMAIVGHEPDFSEIISSIISPSSLVSLKIKKPSVVEVDLPNGDVLIGEVKNLFSPKLAKKLSN